MKIPNEKELKQYQENEKELKRLAKLLRCGIFEVTEILNKIIIHNEELKREITLLQKKLSE
jgi:hypothetical protein